MKIILLFLLIGTGLFANAQTAIDSLHSTRKATILSACLPGAGQVYNKKIWKVPVVYGALATMGYFVKFHHDNYKMYNDALIKRYDTDVNNDALLSISNENLRILSDNSHRNRDLSIAGCVLIYALNIIDAHVDAHLFNFNVDDKLSYKLEPQLILPSTINNSNVVPTLLLTFNF